MFDFPRDMSVEFDGRPNGTFFIPGFVDDILENVGGVTDRDLDRIENRHALIAALISELPAIVALLEETPEGNVILGDVLLQL